jgi:hypothetical protein
MRKAKMPLAFSYLRFSSPEQAKGDSVRRQTEATADWCQRNNAQLDTSLRLEDRGVSQITIKSRWFFRDYEDDRPASSGS